MKKSDQTVLLFEIPLFSNKKSELLKSVAEKVIRTKKPIVIFTPNPEQLVLARKNPHFHNLLNNADYLIPDGIGVVWASRILHWFGQSKPIFEKISGIDLSADFLEWAAEHDWPVLLLGGKGYHQAENSPIPLVVDGKKARRLRIHWLEGYENVGAPTASEEAAVKAALRQLKPKLVLVAFGAPQQEQWVRDHQRELSAAGTKIVMVVGGTFDILFGRLRRAPALLRALGLEWLFRLIQEPRRWRRQLALFEFSGMTFAEIFRKK